MTKISWGAVGSRHYQAGVDRGVLYVDEVGVPWDGLISVDENPSGGDAKTFYIDGIMYLMHSARELFNATVNAYFSPPEFDPCEGITGLTSGMFVTQQRRKQFGLSYRTFIGNDVQGLSLGYKIHIIYNALASPSQKNNVTLGENTDPMLLSWDISVKPKLITGVMRSAHVIIDSRTTPDFVLSNLEDILYGNESNAPRLPDPDEIADLFESSDVFTVTDLGGGEFRITGSSFEVSMLDAGIWQIDSDSGVTVIDADHFEISSP